MAVLGAEDAVAVSGVAARRDTVTASEPRKRRFAERCNRRMAEPHHLLVDAAQRPSVPERVGKRCDLDRDEPVSAGSTCRGVPKPVSPGALHGNACYRVIKRPWVIVGPYGNIGPCVPRVSFLPPPPHRRMPTTIWFVGPPIALVCLPSRAYRGRCQPGEARAAAGKTLVN